jgi:DNA-binding response OmpR family regulator
MLNTTTEPTLKQKLLIIEDEGEMCLLINLLLDDKELDIEHVKTLSAAVEYFQQHAPDVVLIDNRLPDGFGIDFISVLKENYPDTRIIMITGADASVKDLAIENGADVFLEKPFTKTELCQSIRNVLSAGH